jgi:hypothetical protein
LFTFIGWCPVERILPPLRNYSAVLLGTKNLRLFLFNSIEFPEFNLILDNLNAEDLGPSLQNVYNPITNPRSPTFILEDIIKYATNNEQNYEEVAKFGAVINININYNCFLNSFFKPPNDNCKPSYSFRRVGVEKKIGYMNYKFVDYFNNGKTRTLFTSYKIRFAVIVNGKVSQYDLFQFLTNLCAYDTIFGLSLFAFACFVKFLYRKYRIEDNM